MPEGTEHPLHRPQDPEAQPEEDSGKKPCHTVKHRLVLEETRHRGFLRATSAGQAHEKSLAELEGSTPPLGRYLYQEKGVQGVVLPGIPIVPPKNTPRGGELTPAEQATNRRLASMRIRLEHAMGGVKR